MAANLREAFKSCEFLGDIPSQARAMIDADILLVPSNLFEEEQAETLFIHAFPDRTSEQVFSQHLPDLHVVAISSVNKDVRTVLSDHFQEVTFMVAMAPIWQRYRQHSLGTNHRRLYGHFHEHRLDIFAFQQNRFKFRNAFDIKQTKDAIFFLLYVWKQLQFDAQNDELLLSGSIFHDPSATVIQEREELLQALGKYIQKVEPV